ncbi:HAMP domain-containing protein [Desulfotomaculum arcticum]|uniref:histidine kinase n=1 Tax=Desulfotruncus arcticus DSM 17038 TaxID=1121424 RepID=A0A1I2UJ70_9FIRM|nr:ATP-binding protein [Desulfotruncus arcticus]SFG77175.1 HAMP domain-containing protein [Desulfotomaculum arcticum] [Desulfotruncus arcticus DSM 17038]
MKILRKSVVLKLWLFMVALVLIIIYFTGVLQTAKLRQLYYNQQLELLTSEAKHISTIKDINEQSMNANLLSTLAEAFKGNIMIIDRQGYIIHCIGMGMSMKNVADEKISVVGHHDLPWKQSDLQSIMQGKTISYQGAYHFLNSDVLTVAVPLNNEGQVTGSVMLSSPLAPIEERIGALQRITIYAGMIGIALATVLSLLLSRTISRPLLKMHRAARSMARGDYSRRVEVKSQDEIGLLANSLNILATELQEKITTLERLDRTRREFVANVSHELRTPLSIIQGYTEALMDGLAESEAERQKYLEDIHEEILRLRRLVAEILDLRKIEAGQIEMKMQEISLAYLAGQVFEQFQTLAEDKQITASLDIAPGSYTLKADPDRIKQVLINLIDNALRVTPPGGQIKVTLTELKDAVQVSVADTGPGILPEEQPLIWERFYKVDKSRARTGGGTGLGLAIAKNIIETHGGTVDVSSKPGQGSTFYFIIPK